MSKFHFKTRLKAFALHLLGSLAMATAALALVYGLWYPGPLARAVGVSGVFLLMLGVDVALGPLLTFVVYQKGKRSLRFDLAVIVAVQLAALAYGMHAIADGRPAWLVFNADRFDVARANELDTRYLDEALPAYRQPPWTGPRWVASVNPDDWDKRNQLVMESALGGADLPERVDLYRPLADEATQLRQRARPLSELGQFNSHERMSAVIAKWPKANAWLPLMSREQPMVVLIDKKEAAALAVVDLRPWI